MGIVGNLGIMGVPSTHGEWVEKKWAARDGSPISYFYDNVELFAYRDVGVHIL